MQYHEGQLITTVIFFFSIQTGNLAVNLMFVCGVVTNGYLRYSGLTLSDTYFSVFNFRMTNCNIYTGSN